MSDKIANLKEKFRLALTSTAKVISDDFDLINKSSDSDKKKDLNQINDLLYGNFLILTNSTNNKNIAASVPPANEL